jgi:hypothetical protein
MRNRSTPRTATGQLSRSWTLGGKLLATLARRCRFVPAMWQTSDLPRPSKLRLFRPSHCHRNNCALGSYTVPARQNADPSTGAAGNGECLFSIRLPQPNKRRQVKDLAAFCFSGLCCKGMQGEPETCQRVTGIAADSVRHGCDTEAIRCSLTVRPSPLRWRHETRRPLRKKIVAIIASGCNFRGVGMH